ncbi:unnamed protein product [Arabidopsis thaliana]|uniref:Uncharacterized protein n=1 Tax=Arabidopsis thaliana TaxID=3702 RepID=A0A5S9XR13_ARATH|nr:unnamed protein product [Arabidopsis thaliana]
MKKTFSFTILILFVIPLLVTGLVDNMPQRHPLEGWCKRPLPNQKPGPCNNDRCSARCKEQKQFEFKGGKAMGICSSENRCLCTFRCR